MAKEKAKEIWELLSKISFELDQIKKGYKDIEVLRGWMKDMDICITFSAGGWRGGELCPVVLYSSDFDDITKAAIEVIYKRLEQRNAEALEYAREIQAILTEVEE
ncbi:hypothetical protein HMPREF9970_1670 [Lachnoanaerobaculum saburreum F0468]|uniref:Uncharacterized protein n=1 Tax=Lachnoanaerobaculum saburreum F0468 TaxID=1095750 RepID=I0R751_9FIRM|nr:hypothetical protein [Lachnoanaerobaculum saburreum]EIC95509.1 hypothetical protein HMPREF9970_1670 [Lachnoanaerobaculum saburreum F0468]